MNKKVILSIAIILIIAIIGCYISYNNFANEHIINVNGSQFDLPDGYEKSDIVKLGNANITNGSNSLTFMKYDGNNIQEYINNYVNYNNERNVTTIISNFTTGGKEVYKSEINESKNVFHYWFIKDDVVFEISTWDGNNQTDNIVFDLIKNSKNKFLFF